MKIFLDDQVDGVRKYLIPDGWRVARNFDEFQALIEQIIANNERIEGLRFDNDLGNGEKEGWEIAKWITEEHPELFSENPELTSHSANTAAGGGAEKIEQYFKRLQEHRNELIEAKERPNPWREQK